MGQEYRISAGMQIFYGLLAIGMLIFSLFLFDTYKPSVNASVLLIPVLILAGAILIAINIFRRKIIIYDDSILFVNLFSTNEIAISDIKGCRIGDKVIILETNDNSKITVRSYSDFVASDELVNWFKDNFKNLDSADLETEKKNLLSDSALGFTEEERAAKLKKAKQIAIAYNIIGPIVGFASLLMDNKVTIVVALFYPLISIAIMKLSGGLIKFLSNNKRSVYPHIMIGVIFPIFIMFFKFVDTNIFNADNLWFPFLIIVTILFVLFYLTGINRSVGSIIGQMVIMAIIAVLYGLGSVMQVNCLFDSSEVKVYHASVVDRRVSHGKHDDYYVTLSPWGPRHEVKEVNIHKWLYDHALIGDTVEVDFKKGLLNIPWFIVTK